MHFYYMAVLSGSCPNLMVTLIRLLLLILNTLFGVGLGPAPPQNLDLGGGVILEAW